LPGLIAATRKKNSGGGRGPPSLPIAKFASAIEEKEWTRDLNKEEFREVGNVCPRQVVCILLRK